MVIALSHSGVRKGFVRLLDSECTLVLRLVETSRFERRKIPNPGGSAFPRALAFRGWTPRPPSFSLDTLLAPVDANPSPGRCDAFLPIPRCLERMGKGPCSAFSTCLSSRLRPPTDLLPRRLDGHAGDLLLDGFFDFGFQWSPRSHRDSANLPTPRPNKLTVHQERP